MQTVRNGQRVHLQAKRGQNGQGDGGCLHRKGDEWLLADRKERAARWTIVLNSDPDIKKQSVIEAGSEISLRSEDGGYAVYDTTEESFTTVPSWEQAASLGGFAIEKCDGAVGPVEINDSIQLRATRLVDPQRAYLQSTLLTIGFGFGPPEADKGWVLLMDVAEVEVRKEEKEKLIFSQNGPPKHPAFPPSSPRRPSHTRPKPLSPVAPGALPPGTGLYLRHGFSIHLQPAHTEAFVLHSDTANGEKLSMGTPSRADLGWKVVV